MTSLLQTKKHGKYKYRSSYEKWKDDSEHRGHCAVVVSSFGKQRKSISLARTKLQLHRLEAELARVNRELAERPFNLPISTLSPRPAEVKKPLFATVTRENGQFVASFCEANINATGTSRSEAIEMLKDSIVSAYYVLSELEQDLGNEPKRQLEMLREFISEK